ncbi:SUKH-3 domain-containing protein [Streptomyces sp. NPDC048663]|uniref:SUKH-3 domain-containing protein n=1 Tax=Streptomyces sp. NPDC048663 TaxID=3155638 RepID=UPI0034358692
MPLTIWESILLGEQAGADLYPLGMVDRRNRYLAMAEEGAVYMGMDTVTLRAATPDEAASGSPARPCV